MGAVGRRGSCRWWKTRCFTGGFSLCPLIFRKVWKSQMLGLSGYFYGKQGGLGFVSGLMWDVCEHRIQEIQQETWAFCLVWVGFILEDWISGRDKTSGSQRQTGLGGHEPLEWELESFSFTDCMEWGLCAKIIKSLKNIHSFWFI